MADSISNVKVLVKTEGLDKAVKDSAQIANNIERANKAGASMGGSAAVKSSYKESAASRSAPGAGSAVNEREYGVVRGAVGTGAAGRDFAKQAQGLGGLVALYATFAANIFAVGAAYEALNKAAATERLAKATEMMSVSTGVHLKSVSKNLVEASGYALSFSEAMQFTNIGTSAGLASAQIQSLTKIAKGAANALGRDVGDSVRRIIQGTAKQEQEILDELGIFVKAAQAYEKFSAANKIKVADMTGAQRTQAYANEVERLGKKWNEFAEIPDPFSKFSATGKDALNELLASVNKVFTPLLNFLSESKDGIAGIIVLVTAMLTKRAIPEIGNFLTNMFTFDKARIAKEAAGAQQALLDAYTSATAKLIAAKKAREALLIPTVTKDTFKEVVGSAAYASPKNMGISTSRLSTAFIGTEKNPIDTLKTYTSIELVNSKITDTLKEQLKSSTAQDTLLQSLIKKKVIEHTTDMDSLVLAKEGEVIAGKIFATITNTNAAKAQGLALDTQIIELGQEEKLAKKNAKDVISSSAVKSTFKAASNEIDSSATLANSAALSSNTLATEANSSAKVKNAVASNTSAVAEAKSIVPIVAKTGFLAAFTGALATSTAAETLLTAAGGKLGAQLMVLTKEMVSSAVAAYGAAMGQATLANAGILLGSAAKIAATGVKGLLMTLNWLLIPVMLLITAWELFGDTLAKFLPLSVQAALGIGEQGKAAEEAAKKMKDFTEGTELAGAAMERINLLRAKGAESSKEEAQWLSIEGNILQGQIARLNELDAAKDSTASKDLLRDAKAAASKKGLVFSEREYLASQMATAAFQRGDKDTATKFAEIAAGYAKIAAERAKLGSAGAANIFLAADEEKLNKQNRALIEQGVVVNNQAQSAKNAITTANDAIEKSVEGVIATFKKSGDTKLGLTSDEAVNAYEGFKKVLNGVGVNAKDVTQTQENLLKMVQMGGTMAARAAPLYIALSTALYNSTGKDGKVNDNDLASRLRAANVEMQALMLTAAQGLNLPKTPKAPKAIKPYDEESKNQFKALQNEIDKSSLKLKSLANTNEIRKAVDDTLTSINGVASASSIASEKRYAELAAEETLIQTIKKANLDLQKVLQDDSKVGKEGVDAKREAQDAYNFKEKEAILTANSQTSLASINSTKSTAARIATEINIQLTRSNELEANRIGLAQQQLTSEANTLELKKEQGYATEKELTQAQLALDIKNQQFATESAISALGRDAASKSTTLVGQIQANQGDGTNETKTREAAIAQLVIISAEYDRQRNLIEGNSTEALKHLEATGALKVTLAGNNDEMAKMVGITTSLSAVFGEMGDNIGKAGEALLKMAHDDKAYADNKIKLEKKVDAAKNFDEWDEAVTNLNTLEKKAAKDKLGNIAATAGATKKMFAEHTGAYKVLNGIEKAASAFKLAMQLKEDGVKLASFAKDMFFTEAKTTAEVTAAGTKAVAVNAFELSTLPAKISGAIASLFSSSGILAFGLVGAMLAMIGGSGGGASVNLAGLTAADKQETQGTGLSWVDGKKVENGGGVFGDTGAKSTSIVDSLEVMKNNSIEALDYDKNLLKAMKRVADAIGTAAASIYQIPGVRLGSSVGTVEGTSGKSILGWGSSTSTSIQDSGIKLAGTFASLADAGSKSAKIFETILTTTNSSSWFGLSKSSSSNVNTIETELDVTNSKAIAEIFTNATDVFIEIGKTAGVTKDSILATLSTLPISIEASLRGLSGQDLEDALNATIGSALSNAAKAVFYQFEKFKKFGEDYLATTIRVVDGNNKLDQAFKSMGSTFDITKDKVTKVGEGISKFTDGASWMGTFTGDASAWIAAIESGTEVFTELGDGIFTAYSRISKFDMSEALIAGAGGLETFMEQANFFTDNFLTEAERLAPIKTSVAAQVASLGLNPITSREQFKNLVLAQDLSTEAGRKLFQSLMELAPGLDTVLTASEELIASQKDLANELLSLQGYTYEVTLRERATTLEELALKDSSLVATQRLIYAQEDLNKTTDLNIKLLEVQGFTQEALVLTRRKELLALSETDRAIQIQIWAFDDLKTTADKAYNTLTTVVSAERKIVQDSLNTSKTLVTELTSLFTLLKKQVSELYNEVSSTSVIAAVEAKQYIDTILATATTTGALPNSTELGEAITEARKTTEKNNFATAVEADRAKLLLASKLVILRDLSKTQLTTAELQLKNSEDQLASLDLILETAKKQMDVFNNIDTGIKTVAEAVAALTAALIKPKSIASSTGASNGVIVGPSAVVAGPSAEVGSAATDPYKSSKYMTETYLGAGYGSAFREAEDVPKLDSIKAYINTLEWGNPATEAASARAVAEAAAQYGVSQTEIASAMHLPFLDTMNFFKSYDIPRFADGGFHAGGLAMVGEEGPEVVNFKSPSQIYTASQSRNILGGKDAALLEELRMLRKEVADLKAATNTNVGYSKKTTDLLSRVTQGGDAMVVEAYASDVVVLGL